MPVVCRFCHNITKVEKDDKGNLCCMQCQQPLYPAEETKDKQIKCHKCAYDWKPRVSRPKACPRCKTRLDPHKP